MARRKRNNKKPRPRRRKPNFLIFLLIFALIIIGGVYIASLPIWRIQAVVVNGAKMLSPDEVRTLAGIPLSENLFFTSFSRAKANLGKITAIEKASFYRMPPATVLINITERQPIATIVFSKKSIIIDKAGYIINRNANLTLNVPNRAELPVVTGISEKRILKADRIHETVSKIVAEIIFKLSPYLASGRIQLELGGLENISFLLDDLLRVKLGMAENVPRKMEVFEALLPVIAGKWSEVEYVDVRYPDNPVIKYR